MRGESRIRIEIDGNSLVVPISKNIERRHKNKQKKRNK